MDSTQEAEVTYTSFQATVSWVVHGIEDGLGIIRSSITYTRVRNDGKFWVIEMLGDEPLAPKSLTLRKTV